MGETGRREGMERRKKRWERWYDERGPVSRRPCRRRQSEGAVLELKTPMPISLEGLSSGGVRRGGMSRRDLTRDDVTMPQGKRRWRRIGREEEEAGADVWSGDSSFLPGLTMDETTGRSNRDLTCRDGEVSMQA